MKFDEILLYIGMALMALYPIVITIKVVLY